MNQKKRRMYLIIGAIVVVVLLVGGYILAKRANSANTVQYVYGTVTKGTLTKTVSVVGNIAASHVQTGTFSVDPSAIVTDIFVKPGDMVKKGQKLAKIDRTNLSNKLTQAQASLDQAKNNYYNLFLKSSKTLTYADVNSAKAQISNAQANYDSAKRDYDNGIMTAEFAGQVVSVGFTVGSAGGTNSIVVVDPKSLYVDAAVSEYDLANIQKNMPATVAVDALNSKSYVGKVTDVSLNPTVTSNVVTYDIQVGIPANDGLLRLGYSTTVTINVISKENVLLVPSNAVKTNSSGNYVQVMNNGQVQNKPVEVGLVGDTQTELITGLNEGDQIIVSQITKTTTTGTANNSTFQFGGGVGGAGAGGTGTRQFIRQGN